MNPVVNVIFYNIEDSLVGWLWTHTYEMRWDTRFARHIQARCRFVTLWHPRFWFWEFVAIKAGGWICKKIVLGNVESMRYATLHSWGLALVQYTRFKIEDISISSINYCKIMLCYWLVLSTYNVDFLKYFTFFNKLFNKSLLFIYTSKKNQFSP